MTAIAHPATFARGVPHDEFAKLRADGGVGWVEEPELWRHSATGRMLQRGSGFWAVTAHDTIIEVSRRPEDFSSALKGAFLVDPRTQADLQTTRQLLVNMDAPQHSRIRKIVTPFFTPRAIRELSAGVQRHANQIVERAMGMRTFDAVTDLAAELPLLVLADLLGVPRDDRHLFYRWSNNLVGFDDPEYGGGDIDAYRRTFAEAFQYALGIAYERREHPRDDLISLLANAPLKDREFCQFWLLLVVAGNETTRHLLSNSVRMLIDDPALRTALRDTPSAKAVEEFLRMVTPIMQFRRTAVRDVTLAGRDIAAGDKVVVYYVSGNRDEQAFTDPDTVHFGRDPNPHLSFGIGPHFCLGAHLARMEATAMLDSLRPHLHRLRFAGPVVRLESNFVNGIKSMPLSVEGSPR